MATIMCLSVPKIAHHLEPIHHRQQTTSLRCLNHLPTSSKWLIEHNQYVCELSDVSVAANCKGIFA